MRQAFFGFGLGIALLACSSAHAQTVSVGTIVYGSDDEVVGKVTVVKGDAAIIETGIVRVTLGLSSFNSIAGRTTIAMTTDEVERAAAQVQSAGDTKLLELLKPGAKVYASDGTVVATVESVEGSRVMLTVGTLSPGFPISAFSEGPSGARIDLSAEEFKSRVHAAAPSKPPVASLRLRSPARTSV